MKQDRNSGTADRREALPRGAGLALAYLAALLVVPFYIGPEIVPNLQLNAERAILILLVALALTGRLPRLLHAPLGHLWRDHTALTVTLLGYFVWRAIAALWSPHAVSTYLLLNELASEAFVFVIFAGLLGASGGQAALARVLGLAVPLIGALVAVELALGHNPLAALAPESGGFAIRAEVIERAGLMRAKGTFEHPLVLGNMVILLLPLFVLGGPVMGGRALRWGSVLILLAMGMATGSRAVQMIMLAQCGLGLVLGRPVLAFGGRPLHLWLIVLPLGPSIALWVADRAASATGLGLMESDARAGQIRNGLLQIGQSPWTGFGAGPGPVSAIREAAAHGSGAAPFWAKSVESVDNWYLSVLLASGWPALALFAGLVGGVVLTAAGKALRLRHMPSGGLAAGLAIALGSGAALMAVLSIFTLHPLYFILAAWATRIDKPAAHARQAGAADLPPRDPHPGQPAPMLR